MARDEMDETDDLQDVAGGPTWEELGHKMYDPKLLNFHTQIDKPDQTSTLDVYAEYVSENVSRKVGNILKGYAKWKRTNMVPYKRERAKETERMVKGNIEQERKKKDMEEVLTGLQR